MKWFIFLPIVYVYTGIAPKKLAWQPANRGLQRSYSLCAQPLSHVLLGLLPRWQALSQQRLTLLRYFDKMAAPVLSGLQPKPALRIHSLDIAAEGRLVQLEQLGQLGGSGQPAVCDRHEDRKLAGLQSGACQCAIVDRREHPIQLPNTTGNAFAFNPLGSFGHGSLYMQVTPICQAGPCVKVLAAMTHFATNSQSS